jgi:hypothetical protein
MKIFSGKSFKSLAFAGALAMVVSSAYAISWAECQPGCQQAANNAYNQAYAGYTTQQTNYCNSLTDPSAKSACLAAVPAYANQQASNVYTQAYNSCMNSCTHV